MFEGRSVERAVLFLNHPTMHRKDFLKRVGITGLILPIVNACSKADPTPSTNSTTTTPGTTSGSSTTTCAVSDTEIDGPYPLYNSRGFPIK